MKEPQSLSVASAALGHNALSLDANAISAGILGEVFWVPLEIQGKNANRLAAEVALNSDMARRASPSGLRL